MREWCRVLTGDGPGSAGRSTRDDWIVLLAALFTVFLSLATVVAG